MKNTRKAKAELAPATEKRRVGRPSKLGEDDKTITTIRGLARIQCTQKEAAGVLGVCENTFNEFLRSHEKGRDAWELGREEGRASLRRMQWQTANKSTTMQIWLGKQYLGQADKMEEAVKANVEHTFVDAAAAAFDRRMAGILARSGTEEVPRVVN